MTTTHLLVAAGRRDAFDHPLGRMHGRGAIVITPRNLGAARDLKPSELGRLEVTARSWLLGRREREAIRDELVPVLVALERYEDAALLQRLSGALTPAARAGMS